jgi:hypothetical protein
VKDCVVLRKTFGVIVNWKLHTVKVAIKYRLSLL